MNNYYVNTGIPLNKYGVRTKFGNTSKKHFLIYDFDYDTDTFKSYDSMIFTLDYNNKTLIVYNHADNIPVFSTTTSEFRNRAFKTLEIPELATTKQYKKAIEDGSVTINGSLWNVITKDCDFTDLNGRYVKIA